MEDIDYIKRRNKERKIRELDIATESIFLNFEMHFKERSLFKNQVYIKIPEEFIEMPSNWVRIKYPSENRPEIILTSPDSTMDFTFSLIEDESESANVFDLITSAKAVIKRKNPANLFYNLKILKSNFDLDIGYCDYLGYALDGDVYVVMYVTRIEEQLLLGTFCCPKESMESWKVIIPQVLKTIHKNEQRSDEDGKRK